MANSEPKKIVIVGGSLAGLFTGIVFIRLGHDVTILERTPSDILIDQGAGISVSTVVPSIFESFRNLTSSGSPILEFFDDYDRTETEYYIDLPDDMQFLKRDGSVKATVTGTVRNASTSWDLLYSTLRANFDGRYEKGYIAGVKRRDGDGKAEYLTGLRVLELEDAGSDLVNVHHEDASGKKSCLEANLVIGADGPSSSVRKLMLPEAERTYSGYVAWRGTVREDLLSKDTEAVLGEKLSFFYYKGGHVVIYKIPGLNGSTKRGERYSNIVWYSNYTPSQLQEILTSTTGKVHTFSLGIGKIRPEIRARQRSIASSILPPPVVELFQKVEQPFIQAITDSIASKAVFMDGKVLLVGDALAGLRTHTAAGTSQAAMHALLLKKVFGSGEMVLGEWEEKVVQWASWVQKMGVQIGEVAQFGDHPQADVTPHPNP
ncbi:FAD/NAD(P)-binding domain-containing protein [Cadophora sp. DSE1049]|nr:FAD/NAD(P)-binding domain-containing protein [Cadophora sp. DSE1049]